MKTNTQHSLIPDDGKRNPVPAGTSVRSERVEQMSPLDSALAAVSDYCKQAQGVDLETYLAAVGSGRPHAEALIIAKITFEDGAT